MLFVATLLFFSSELLSCKLNTKILNLHIYGGKFDI